MINQNITQNTDLIPRPPVVVVLGHVNHGKTTLLDYIRKTKVAEKEAGGITQHIGAYEIAITSNDGTKKKITFIDTPGHEAFSKIRSRGAKAADIALLVIAADEGVKPQTLESLRHIQEAKIPFLVTFTKIDKPGAQVEKIKKELAEHQILLEGWGGEVPFVEVSAKTGQGIDELLEMILLLGEMEDLKANPKNPASGIVIESHLDPRRGYTASLIIQDGTLHLRDQIIAGGVTGKVRILENFLGQQVQEASFSSPVRVVGFEDLPKVGEKFIAGRAEEIEILIPQRNQKEMPEFKLSIIGKEDAPIKIPLIIKADVFNSLDALINILQPLTQKKNCYFKIIKAAVGDLSEQDLKLRDKGNTLVVLFRVKKKPETKNILQQNANIILAEGEIIYELEKQIDEIIDKFFINKPEIKIIGKLEVLAIFNPIKGNQLIGGKVITGKIINKSKVKIIREETAIGEGKIINLQAQKKDVSEVQEGQECGILIESSVNIQKGDYLLLETGK